MVHDYAFEDQETNGRNSWSLLRSDSQGKRWSRAYRLTVAILLVHGTPLIRYMYTLEVPIHDHSVLIRSIVWFHTVLASSQSCTLLCVAFHIFHLALCRISFIIIFFSFWIHSCPLFSSVIVYSICSTLDFTLFYKFPIAMRYRYYVAFIHLSPSLRDSIVISIAVPYLAVSF